MKVGYTSLVILPEATVTLEVINRSGIGITIIKPLNFWGCPRLWQFLFVIILSRHDWLYFWAKALGWAFKPNSRHLNSA